MVYTPNMLNAEHEERQILSLDWHVYSEIHHPLKRQAFPCVFITQLLNTVQLQCNNAQNDYI